MQDQSTRRWFMKLLGAAVTALLAACTQQAVMPAVEFKGATTPNDVVNKPDSLLQQAQVLGAPIPINRSIRLSTRIRKESSDSPKMTRHS